jgi:hypothetical protein
VVNKVITVYLRCLTGDKPKEWIRWLPRAEYCYNTWHRTSIHTTPFKLVYGRDPVDDLLDLLTERDNLEQTKLRLGQSQDYYTKHYNRKHVDRTFQIGDWVWLILMARSTVAISTLQKGKLSPKYFGPYQISEQIGSVTYRMDIPSDIRIHHAFHVSILKKYTGPPPSNPLPMPTIYNGVTVPEPELVLKSGLHRGHLQVLIKWKHQPAAELSCERNYSRSSIQHSSSRMS